MLSSAIMFTVRDLFLECNGRSAVGMPGLTPLSERKEEGERDGEEVSEGGERERE